MPESRALPLSSFVPVETAQEKHLLEHAMQIHADVGEEALIEHLTRPILPYPDPLLPYLVIAIQRAHDHPLTLEPVHHVQLPYITHPLSLLLSSMPTPVLRTACPAIDDMIAGGLPLGTGSIVEISGKAGVGKTQLAAQLALMSALPLAHGGLQLPCIYAFTEGSFPLRRMQTIDAVFTSRYRLDVGSLLAAVIVEHLKSSDHLLHWAQFRLPYLLRTTAARVVIIDSVTAVYRPEFCDPLSRAAHLVEMATALRRAVADVKGLAICINQVSQALDGLNTLNATVPALGSSWASCVSTRLFISRVRHGDQRRFLKVSHSSYLPTTEGPGTPFLITADGVVDDQ